MSCSDIGVYFVAATFAVMGFSRLPQQMSVPLAVERAGIDPGDIAKGRMPAVTITVRNTGTRPIVAWGIRGEVRFSQGVSRPIGTSVDSIGSTALKLDVTRRLLAGARSVTSLDLPSPGSPAVPVDVVAFPTFAIFDDDSALGDEDQIRVAFERRTASHRVWRAVEERLKSSVSSTSDGSQALRNAQSGLDAIADEEVRASTGYLRTRQQIVRGLSAGTSADHARLLQQLLAEATLRRAAAEAHLVRRQ